MASEILMPKMGATMESGTILQWFVEEGAVVEEGERLLEIQTDKINIEVEAEASGMLLKKRYGEDEEVPVKEVIGYIGQEGEVIPESSVITDSEQQLNEANQEVKPEGKTEESSSNQTSDEKSLRRTPSARQLAEEHHIPLSNIKGSGPNGRIHLQDVEMFVMEQEHSKKRVTPLAQKIATDLGVSTEKILGSGVVGKVMEQDVRDYVQKLEPYNEVDGRDKAYTELKVEGMRKVVGERMVESVHTAPHVTLTSEADMSEVIRLRKSLLPIVEKQTGYRLSYTEIILKTVAMTLKDHPKINASLQGNMIKQYQDIHVGLAVSVENGLYVPVVRHADQKGLGELTVACKTLAQAARDNQLSMDDLSGGTFTISNLGMYAVDAFTPIINQPESAILGLGRIAEKPVGLDGEIVLRPMMSLSLSFDHRVVDGAPAAAFLTELKQKLEQPFQLLI